jgi:hypothetical protein
MLSIDLKLKAPGYYACKNYGTNNNVAIFRRLTLVAPPQINIYIIGVKIGGRGFNAYAVDAKN